MNMQANTRFESGWERPPPKIKLTEAEEQRRKEKDQVHGRRAPSPEPIRKTLYSPLTYFTEYVFETYPGGDDSASAKA